MKNISKSIVVTISLIMFISSYSRADTVKNAEFEPNFFTRENIKKYRNLVWDFKHKKSKVNYNSHFIADITNRLNPDLKTYTLKPFKKDAITTLYFTYIPKKVADLFTSPIIKSHNYPAVLTDVYVNHRGTLNNESNFIQEFKIEKQFDKNGFVKDIIHFPLLIDTEELSKNTDTIPTTEALITTAWDYIKLEAFAKNEFLDTKHFFDKKKKITYLECT